MDGYERDKRSVIRGNATNILLSSMTLYAPSAGGGEARRIGGCESHSIGRAEKGNSQILSKGSL